MPELSTSVLVAGGRGLKLSDGTVIETYRTQCPECEKISSLTTWEDMGSKVRYRLTCPKGHAWEILP
jgi:hypothetical protein